MTLNHEAGLRRPVLTALAILVLSAVPAAAAHRARLSADLADHMRAGSPVIDVIVHGTRQEVETLTQRYNLRVRKHLKSGAVLRVTAGELAALQRDEAVDHLSSDIRYRSTSDILTEAIGADQVWAGTNTLKALSGRGVGVAVIDSGVDPTHNALRGRVAASVDFTGGDGIDRYGHGTHVAALIAGGQGRLAETREYQGVAPGARIISLRVLGDDGSGSASNLIEAIDWAIDNRKAYDIRVINLSLGAPVLQPYRDDPVCEAVQRAVAAGIVVVAAAGNFGRTKDGKLVFGGVTSPGNDPSVITVGAVDMQNTAARSDDTIARFSSRGPTRYDLVLKPDLVAPGSRLVSAEAAGSYLGRTYPDRRVAGAGADAYLQLSGTSMAAAVVSGAVSLLLEQRRHLTTRDTKTILQITSSLMPGEGLVSTGAGSLNVLAAAKLLNSKHSSNVVPIAGERVRRGGLSFEDTTETYRRLSLLPLKSIDKLGPLSRALWDTDANDTIIWSTGDTIIWSTSDADTIIWSNSDESETIIWSTGALDTIIWSTNHQDGETIIWSVSDTIIWSTTDTVKWSVADVDTIIWSTSFENEAFWT
jgi:serine protease AprX